MKNLISLIIVAFVLFSTVNLFGQDKKEKSFTAEEKGAMQLQSEVNSTKINPGEITSPVVIKENPQGMERATRTTIASGYWEDRYIWSGGRVPTSGDDVVINHDVDIYGLYTSVSCKNITINAGKKLNLFGEMLMVFGNVTNNGIIDGDYAYQSGNTFYYSTLYFKGTTNQSFANNGSVTTFLYVLSLDNTNTVTVTGNTFPVFRMNLFYGTLTTNSKITTGLGGANSSVIQIGVPSSEGKAGVINGNLNYNIGTGGHYVLYSESNQAITMGVEIPSTNSVYYALFGNPNDVTMTRNLTVAGNVEFLEGTLDAGSYTLTINGTINNAGYSTYTGLLNGNGSTNLTFGGTPRDTLPTLTGTFSNVNIGSSKEVDLKNGNGDVPINNTLTVNTNGKINIGANNTVAVSGTITNSGTVNGGSQSNLVISGNGAQVTIPSVTNGLNSLTVNRSNGIKLSGSLSVANNITLTNGDLDLNGNTITLGSTGTLMEIGGRVKGSTGTITTTRTLNAPAGENIGGLGVSITSSQNLGTTVITRGHTRRGNGVNLGIERYYDISPANNTGLNATVVFKYSTLELAGISEDKLSMFKSIDGGSNWLEVEGVLNMPNKTLTVTGVNGFSIWTPASKDAPLPVEMKSFTSNVSGRDVKLFWTTSMEINNSGFEVQRTESGKDNWQKIGFVSGMNNSNTLTDYSYTDSKLEKGKFQYRLKQIDFNGNYEIFILENEVNVNGPGKFNLSQNYPNPFNPTTKIDFELPQDSKVNITVYDMLGKVVKVLENSTKKSGYYTISFDGNSLSSGIYIYKLTAESNGNISTIVKKMTLVK